MNKDLFNEVQRLRTDFVSAYADWIITKYSRRELKNIDLVVKRAERLREALASLPVKRYDSDGVLLLD